MPAHHTTIIRPVTIRNIRRSDGAAFIDLINALADFEKLKRPSPAARKRLLRHAFGNNRKFDTFLACVQKKPVGYAIIFETYSSFRAQPTLYLEDIFVLPEYRAMGIGLQLFNRCKSEAIKRKCGRFEWMVLDWNTNAIRFYERRNATQMKEWLLHRIEL